LWPPILILYRNNDVVLWCAGFIGTSIEGRARLLVVIVSKCMRVCNIIYLISHSKNLKKKNLNVFENENNVYLQDIQLSRCHVTAVLKLSVHLEHEIQEFFCVL
jgi:hypothetical protein